MVVNSKTTTNFLALILMACTGARAADSGNWEALNGLHAGQRIRLVRTNLTSVVRVTGGSISVHDGSAERTVAKAEVFRVTTKGGRAGRAAIGAAIGAAAGLALTLVAAKTGGNSDGIEYAVAAGGAATGGLIGAGVGALIPPNTTVYRASLPSGRTETAHLSNSR